VNPSPGSSGPEDIGAPAGPSAPADQSASTDGAASTDQGELLVGLLALALQAVGSATTPLDAEAVLCRLLAMIEIDAPSGVSARQLGQLRSGLLADLVERAEREGSPDALGLLRVCAVFGPGSTRTLAADAAGRLSASGVADPDWAGQVGRPAPVSSWWYGDGDGHQESVGLLFEYPGGQHVIAVLLDHDLGGGIRDCWWADGPEAAGLRERTAEMIESEPGATFRDLDPAAALEVLGPAVAAPRCAPEAQAEDVAIGVELLRARLELLVPPTSPS
jgi:hypothetical protein